MSETQETISRWGWETFGATSAKKIAHRMAQEVEELLEAFSEVPDVETPFVEPGKLKALQDECADIQIMLYQVAEELGAHLGTKVDEKMEINRKRQWKLDEFGNHQHVEEFTDFETGVRLDCNKWYVQVPKEGYLLEGGFADYDSAAVWANCEHIRKIHGIRKSFFPRFDGPKLGWAESPSEAALIKYGADIYAYSEHSRNLELKQRGEG